MKPDVFQSCGHCWVFQILWHIECSTFTASSFMIWNSSPGIESPSLALFLVMLPKAHLTSHSWMSGSKWVGVITPSWFSGSWRSFLYGSSVYSNESALHIRWPKYWGFLGLPGGSEVKASASNAGDPGSIPGSGRSPGEGNGKPLQYSCLENPTDGEALQATVHRITASQTWLSDFTFTFCVFLPPLLNIFYFC